MTRAVVERTVARRGVAVLLSANERATFDALPVERRRRDYLAGRLAAKRALRAACREAGGQVPPYSAIDVWNDAAGAPHVRIDTGDERFSISIAHTDGAAVALAGRAASGTVGVDIETTRPLDLSLVSRVLTPAELARLRGASEDPSPLALWTAKEAALKAAHRFCAALRDVELTWDRHQTFRARVIGDRAPAHDILVRHGTVGPYTIAAARCQ